MQVEIISTGDEVITGFITDTNVAWLCQELLSLGIQPRLRHTVGDNLEDIVSLLKERSEHCDVLLVNGGMGPTSDDNTTEAAALAAGVPQVLNQTWLTRLEAWHKERGRTMPQTNVKQAMLPEGAQMLDNPRGTACGFMLKINRATCFFTPGVPSEFRPMYLNEIRPRLVKDFLDGVHTQVKRLFLFGISESLLGQKIEALQLPASIVVGGPPRASFLYRALPQKKFVKIRKHPEACASGHFLYDKGENYELCFASPMSSSTLCLYYRTFSQKVKPIPRKISKNYFFVICNISRKFYAQTCTLFCKILTNCPVPPRFATRSGKRGTLRPPPKSSPQAP